MERLYTFNIDISNHGNGNTEVRVYDKLELKWYCPNNTNFNHFDREKKEKI